MALGGGNFVTQNKVLPGTYINFTSAGTASAELSDRGIVAAAMELGYSPNDVFEVTNEDFQKNSLKIFGRTYSDPTLKNVRELFCHASKVYFYNVCGDGVRASNTYATAKNVGTAGNNFKIKIADSVDQENKLIVSTIVGTTVVDEQIIDKISEATTSNNKLIDNDFVEFKKNVVPATTAGLSLTNGTNGSYSGSRIQMALDKFEQYSFNVIVCSSELKTDKSLIINYTKRLRDENGNKLQCVIYDYNNELTPDHEGVIRLTSKTTNSGEAVSNQLIYWLAGAEAWCPVNRTLTNLKYDGEYEVDTDNTQEQLKSAVKNGMLMFHRVGDEVRILKDINSLTTFTDDKGESFSSNQVIRVLDQIANDIAVLFNTQYLGILQNNQLNRIAFKNDLVKHHQELQKIGAVDNFTTDDVTVEQGEKKGSVIVVDNIEPIEAMEQLYMTVVVN